MLKISVVEDNEDIRNSLIKTLTRLNNIELVNAYSDGESALKGLPVDNPDLVLMDIGLPGITGPQCMVQLHDQALKADFIMFTVWDSNEHLFEALCAGAIGYILKKEGSSGVIRAIQDYQLGGGPMSRSVARRVMKSFRPAPKTSHDQIDGLTKQQSCVLRLLAEGMQNKEVADRLKITTQTVKQHNVAIYRKLGVNNRTEAVAKLFSSGKRTPNKF